MKVVHFLLRLPKGKLDLTDSEPFEIGIHALQDKVNVLARERNVTAQSLLVGFRVDVRFFEEHKFNSLVVKLHIQLHTLGSVTAHTAHAVKYDDVTALDLS